MPKESQRSPEMWWDEYDESLLAQLVWHDLFHDDEFRRWRLYQVRELVGMLERDLWNNNDQWAIRSHFGLSNSNADVNTNAQKRTPWEGAAYNQALSDCVSIETQLTREMPDIVVRPSNASYDLQQRTERMSAVLDATMNRDSARLHQQGFHQWGLWYGFGACVPLIRDGQMSYESIREHELVYDYGDAINGRIETLHYWTRMSKGAVLNLIDAGNFPHQAKKMAHVRNMQPSDWWINSPTIKDGLTPYEEVLFSNSSTKDESVLTSWSYHLPYRTARDGDSATEIMNLGGRIIIAVHNGDQDGNQSMILSDTPMKRRRLPIAMWSPMQAYQGLFSMGLATMLKPFQLQRDKIMIGLYEDLLKMHRPVVLCSDGYREQVESAMLNSGVEIIFLPTSMMTSAGKPYEIIPANPQSPQALGWLETINELSARYVGSSEVLQAGYATGGGANESGRAKLVDDDRVANRHSTMERRLLVANQDLAVRTIDECDDEAERNPSFSIHTRGVDSQRFNWSEVSLPGGDFDVQMEEQGVLAKRKSGRVAQLQEMITDGTIERDDGLSEISRSADLRKITARAMAPRDLVAWQLAGLAKKGKKPAFYAKYMPQPDMDYGIGEQLALAEKQTAIRKEASEEFINRLNEYLDQCRTALTKQKADQPPPEVPMGGELPPEAMGMEGEMLPPELPPEAMGEIPPELPI